MFREQLNKNIVTKKGLSSFSLKCIAAVCMILDHAGEYLQFPVFFRYIGRLAAPLFIYCCVLGCIHTKDIKRYMKRLYIGGIIMAIFDMWAQIHVNFFRTLFSIVLIIAIVKEYEKTKDIKVWLKYIAWQVLTSIICYLIAANTWVDLEGMGAYILPALFGNLLFLEGGIFYVLVGVWFYYTHDNRKKRNIGYIIMVLVFVIGMQSNPYLIYGIIPKIQYLCGAFGEIAGVFIEEILGNGYLCVGTCWYRKIGDNYQWMMLAAIPFIELYDGTKGKGGKWFFYIFYPVHYILFYCIGTYLL